MKILVFDIQGTFAHFRKFYANSTSLSYEFPPRTTVCGMLAGILGIERDGYYETFSEDQAFIAVQVKSPTKRLSQNINYHWVKSTNDLNGSGGRMQIPLEWVINAKGIGYGNVRYRLYVYHNDHSIQEQLASNIYKGKTCFPLCLGITEALGTVQYVDEVPCEIVSLQETVEIATISPIHFLQDITYLDEGERRLYMRDRVPCDFDSNRMLSRITQMIYEPQGKGIMAKPKSVVYRANIEEENVYVLPMQSEFGRGWEDV